jgi:DNA-binding IclR family transcriptional regulator
LSIYNWPVERFAAPQSFREGRNQGLCAAGALLLLHRRHCCTDAIMPNPRSPRVRAVPAVTRAVAILRLLSRSRTPQGLKAIAESLELVPSTALHIVRALVAEDLLQVDPQTKRYRLGVGMLPLARAVLENADFPSLVRPKLDDLSSRYGVTAIGVEVPDLDNMIVVALARSEAPVRLHVDVGSRFPALISATGRCVAAFSGQPVKEIEKRFRLLRWHNAPTYDTWRKEVDQARKQGFSIDRGNYIAGVTVVAVPVLNGAGTISHTLAAVGLGSQLDRASALALARDMRAAAQEVTAQLVPGSHA